MAVMTIVTVNDSSDSSDNSDNRDSSDTSDSNGSSNSALPSHTAVRSNSGILHIFNKFRFNNETASPQTCRSSIKTSVTLFTNSKAGLVKLSTWLPGPTGNGSWKWYLQINPINPIHPIHPINPINPINPIEENVSNDHTRQLYANIRYKV